MNHTFTITGARSIPQLGGHKDVLAKISWTVQFERDGFKSIGGGETMLDVSTLNSVTPLDQVSKEQMVQWLVAAEGGDAFITMLSDFHGKMIDAKALDAKSVSVYLPFIAAPAPQQGYQITYNLEAQG